MVQYDTKGTWRLLAATHRRPCSGLEPAAKDDKAVPIGGEHIGLEVCRDDIEHYVACVANGEGPDHCVDAHRSVLDGDLQHLQAHSDTPSPPRKGLGGLDARSQVTMKPRRWQP